MTKPITLKRGDRVKLANRTVYEGWSIDWTMNMEYNKVYILTCDQIEGLNITSMVQCIMVKGIPYVIDRRNVRKMRRCMK